MITNALAQPNSKGGIVLCARDTSGHLFGGNRWWQLKNTLPQFDGCHHLNVSMRVLGISQARAAGAHTAYHSCLCGRTPAAYFD